MNTLSSHPAVATAERTALRAAADFLRAHPDFDHGATADLFANLADGTGPVIDDLSDGLGKLDVDFFFSAAALLDTLGALGTPGAPPVPRGFYLATVVSARFLATAGADVRVGAATVARALVIAAPGRRDRAANRGPTADRAVFSVIVPPAAAAALLATADYFDGAVNRIPGARGLGASIAFVFRALAAGGSTGPVRHFPTDADVYHHHTAEILRTLAGAPDAPPVPAGFFLAIQTASSAYHRADPDNVPAHFALRLTSAAAALADRARRARANGGPG